MKIVDFIFDFRQILAKRSVAENSFNEIVGMKAEGSGIASNARGYMEVVYDNLGIGDPSDILNNDVETLLGEYPSYHAQMEVLTKKLYQRPEFYTNLYDKPVNVERKGASLRAIGLMQNMDRFKSQLRSEAILSVLLEVELLKMQEDLQKRMDNLED